MGETAFHNKEFKIWGNKMSKDSVALIGLHWNDAIKGKTVFDKMENVWVLNDWYQFYRWLKKPKKIFNIHEHPFTHPSPDRFTGDWKAEYNKTGAEVVVFNEGMTGVNNQRMLEWEELEGVFPRKAYQCSLVCMMAVAMLEGMKEIYIFGFSLSEAEYDRELLPTLAAIKEARRRGVVVHNPNEEEWNEKAKPATVAWGEIHDFIYYMFKDRGVQKVDTSIFEPKK